MVTPYISEQFLAGIKELRHELHRHPELSNQETGTKQYLMDYLKSHTSLEVRDEGCWFYAYKKGIRKEDAIAFRADFDALPIQEDMDISYNSETDGVSHKCGHDGHSAALCAAALLLDQIETERSIYFIFQHAEEIGQGGEVCAELLGKEPISEVYAWHNRSGYPLHQIVVKPGPMQCASKGLTVCFYGKRSHASEPEKGLNPAFAIGKLIRNVEELALQEFEGRTLYTIIHMNVGTRDFGVSPGDGEISFTLRADYQKDLEELERKIRFYADSCAKTYGLSVEFETSDPFPETSNDAICTQKIINCAKEAGFSVEIPDSPWRASEDFGYYTQRCPGAMFFIGSGEEWTPLHNENYDFNDEILETAVKMFISLI